MNTRGRNNGNRNNKKSSFSKDGSQDKKTTGSKFGKFSKPFPKAEKPVANKPLVAKDDAMRLNKYIANSGVCSRRDADLYIQSGNFLHSQQKRYKESSFFLFHLLLEF